MFCIYASSNKCFVLFYQSIVDREELVDGVVDIPSDEDEDSEEEEDFEALNKRMEESKVKIIKAVKDNVSWLMDQKREVNSLRQIQGHMWREAFKMGKVVGMYVYINILYACTVCKKH